MQGGAAGVGPPYRALPARAADQEHLQRCFEGEVQEGRRAEGKDDMQSFGKGGVAVARGVVARGLEAAVGHG